MLSFYWLNLFNALAKRTKIRLYILIILSLFSALLQALTIASLLPYLNSVSNPSKFAEDNSYFISAFGINTSALPFIISFMFLMISLFSAYLRIKINSYAHHLSADIELIFQIKYLPVGVYLQMAYPIIVQGSFQINR